MGNKDREFNSILDECLDRILLEGQTTEQCVNDYPEIADELRTLLDAATLTSQVNQLAPTPEFRDKARTEFHAYLREASEKKSRSFFGFGWLVWQRRFATSIAAILTVVIVTGGTAAASLNSMPNDFLYPVKRAAEQVQLAFTFTSISKSETYAKMADRRIEEIVYMASLDDGEKIELLASSLNSNLISIAALSSGQTNDSSSVIAEESAQAFEMDETDMMETATVSNFEMPEFDDEAGLSVMSESIMTDDAETPRQKSVAPVVTPGPATLSGTLGGTVGDIDPRMVLNTTIVVQANSNISRLYDLLEIVPESIRPAIEKAIELSEQGYEIAINSLQ